jgi:hypothetical protein
VTALNQAQSAALDGYLASLVVSNQLLAEALDPRPEEIFVKKLRSVEPWKSLITDYEVWEFSFRRISCALGKVPIEYSGLVSAAPDGAAIIAELRANLVAYLESLPRTYYAYFPLRNLPALGGEVRLTRDISLVDTAAAGALEMPLMHAQGGLAQAFGIYRPNLELNTRYVRISVEGVGNGILTANAMTRAAALFKHFVFLSLARDVIKDEFSIRLGLPHSLPLISRYELDDDDERTSIQLPEEFDRYIQRLSYNPDKVQYYDFGAGQTLLTGTNRVPTNPAEYTSAFKTAFGKPLRFLVIPRDDPNSVRIKAAIEWWIDAALSQNQTIAFLQYCLGLEALLGEPSDTNNRSQERGITERLADRYAYLLGKTQVSRTDLRNKFREIYNQRGDLVHQRAVNLPRPTTVHIEAQRMLYKAIVQEINNYLGSLPQE